jgi:hypothetical protein
MRLNVPLDAAVKLVGWSVAEPGLYLLAACGLKFRPAFIMLGRVLHVSKLCGSGSAKSRGAGTKPQGIQLSVLPNRQTGFRNMNASPEGSESTTNIIAARA